MEYIIGAAIGAGVAEATGGDWKKGAMLGAAGGAVGGAAAPSAGVTQATIMGAAVAPTTFGAVAGGAAGGIGATQIGKMGRVPPMPPIPKKATLTTQPSPRPQAVQLEAVKERERLAMRKRRGYMSTILTRGGLGSVQTRKTKVLGE